MTDLICKAKRFIHLNPDYSQRTFGLDLMRALAIILVVMTHGSMLAKAETDFPWIRLIDGVELFFVLSGFLIGSILIRTFEEEKSPGFHTLKNFWIRRWMRTLPNYYLVLVLNIIVVYAGIIREDFSQFNWKFFFFLQNFSEPFMGFFWESWSLSIEEWFYFLFPLLLGLLYFTLRMAGMSRRYIFLLSIAVFLLIPFCLRAFHASYFEVDSFWLGVKIFKVVIYRLDGIALGLLGAYIKHWHPAIWHHVRNYSFIAGIILCYFVLYSAWQPNEYSTKVLKIFFISIGCFLLLPKFDSIKTASPLLVKVVTHISLISYSMYLLNLALVSEVMRDNFPPSGPITAWISYIIYWIAVLLFSTLLYKYYERPLTELRNNVEQMRGSAGAGARGQ